MRNISLFMILLSAFFSGQVGVNTSNPQGAFHIDGAKDNPTLGTPSSGQQLNDFIVTANGNVGAGTTAPNTYAKLDVIADDKGILVPRVDL